MRVSIVKDGNTVNVDGERHEVDLSSLPANFHALQWDGASGEIEYAMVFCEHCGTRGKRPNETITDFTPYMVHLNGWYAAKAKAEREAAEQAAKIAEEAAKLAEAQKAQADAAGPQG